MRESERSFSKIVRNSVTAAAIITASNVAIHEAFAEPAPNSHVEILNKQTRLEESDLSFFEQADEFMETNTGRSIAGLLLVATALNMIWTIHHGSRVDDRRKYINALGSSGMMLALSSTALASSFTEIDPRIPAGIFQAQLGFQAIYTALDENQRWRGLSKTPRIGAAIALFGIGTALLVDSFK